MSEPVEHAALTDADVRKVAALARVAVAEGEVAALRRDLGAVLGYMQRLGALDLSGVEPMTSPVEIVNRLGADEPGPMLSNADLMAMAPRPEPPFVGVPKVLGDGSGA